MSGEVLLTFALRYFVLPLLFHQGQGGKIPAQEAGLRNQEEVPETPWEGHCHNRVVEDRSQTEGERWHSQDQGEVDQLALVDGRLSRHRRRLSSHSIPMLPDLR